MCAFLANAEDCLINNLESMILNNFQLFDSMKNLVLINDFDDCDIQIQLQLFEKSITFSKHNTSSIENVIEHLSNLKRFDLSSYGTTVLIQSIKSYDILFDFTKVE